MINNSCSNNSWDKTLHTTHPDDIESYYFEEHTALCCVPSPFILSKQRRACCMHQSSLFHTLPRYLEQPCNQDNRISRRKSQKFVTAESTFDQWWSKKSKLITSNRLGIRYTT